MPTKLTLTIEDKIIGSAKKYAKSKGKSLSQLVENYLKTISATPVAESTEAISPQILKLMGVIKLSEDFDYKKELGNALLEKYMK